MKSQRKYTRMFFLSKVRSILDAMKFGPKLSIVVSGVSDKIQICTGMRERLGKIKYRSRKKKIRDYHSYLIRKRGYL